MGQYICFGAMCDIVANSHINVIKGLLLKKSNYMDIMSYRTYKLCPFITFLALATNNHIGLLIVCVIIIIPCYFQTRICYVFCALDITIH